jgi:hypothetical protein
MGSAMKQITCSINFIEVLAGKSGFANGERFQGAMNIYLGGGRSAEVEDSMSF